MNKERYMLIKVIDREIYCEYFDNFEEAYECMKSELMSLDIVKENLRPNENIKKHHNKWEFDFWIGEDSACANNYDDDYDWEIVKLP